jgi:hypothetical protein
MFRHLLMRATIALALVWVPAIASAQPPSPAAVAKKVDRGVRRALTNTDRAVRRTVHRSRAHTRRTTHRVVRTTHRSVRAVCRDGRIHYGRTRASACASHGGLRG